MTYSAMQTLFAMSYIVCVAMMAGCQFSTEGDRAVHPGAMQIAAKKTPVFFQQFIIKFKPNTITCDAEALARFSLSVKVPIEFVRTMSDRTCVIRHITNKEGDLPRGEIMLRQHPDVEWLELDSIKKAL